MRYLVLTLAITAALRAAAGCENSTMEVHTALHRPIKVYVDGHTGSNPPTVGVVINNIPPGMHRIQVVEVRTNRFGEQTHTTVYNGNIDVRPSVYMDARVDEYRGISIHDTHVPCDQSGSAPQATAPADNSPVSPAPVQATPPAPAVPDHMSDADFKKLVATITASKYETKKLDTLRATIANDQLVTDQVRQLMNLFSFESNKLEVAELLYTHTVDQQNYSKLAAGFNFQANKDAFDKFLAGK